MSRILIADDHPFLRAGVAALLEDAGHEIVASVANGKEALDAIAASRPDIAILDVRMPDPDGLQALKKARAAGHNLPIILLAAELDDEDLLEGMKLGADAILFKHSAADLLLHAIMELEAGRRHYASDVAERLRDIAVQPRVAQPMMKLNEKEREIAILVSKGKRNREIGLELGITEGTVKSYLHSAYVKLGIGNRARLASLVLASEK